MQYMMPLLPAALIRKDRKVLVETGNKFVWRRAKEKVRFWFKKTLLLVMKQHVSELSFITEGTAVNYVIIARGICAVVAHLLIITMLKVWVQPPLAPIDI